MSELKCLHINLHDIALAKSHSQFKGSSLDDLEACLQPEEQGFNRRTVKMHTTKRLNFVCFALLHKKYCYYLFAKHQKWSISYQRFFWTSHIHLQAPVEFRLYPSCVKPGVKMIIYNVYHTEWKTVIQSWIFLKNLSARS